MAGERTEYASEPALAEVDPATAADDVQSVFAETRDVLRVPYVDQLWRVLAHDSALLRSAWDMTGPALGTFAAERAADVLRREAVIPEALGLPSHKAFRGDMSRAEIGADDRAKISNFTMAAHYHLPKILLATVLLAREQTDRTDAAPIEDAEVLPRGAVAEMPLVFPVNPDEVFGEAVDLFREIRERHGYRALSDYYRTIVRAGDFLRIAWNALRPIVGDPEFYARAAAVSARARELAATLPAAGASLASLSEAQPAVVRTVARFFLERLLPETLVELTIIKGLTDGPEGATQNRYSLTEG
jgi:hypothetical protein